jgi:hypothetical protein
MADVQIAASTELTTDPLLATFLRDLHEVRLSASMLDATSHEGRMHLGFRTTAMVHALTRLADRVHACADRPTSRADLASRSSTSASLSTGETELLSRWLHRHHAVSVFVLASTCVRWANEIAQDADALRALGVRLSSLAQAGGGASAR